MKATELWFTDIKVEIRQLAESSSDDRQVQQKMLDLSKATDPNMSITSLNNDCQTDSDDSDSKSQTIVMDFAN